MTDDLKRIAEEAERTRKMFEDLDLPKKFAKEFEAIERLGKLADSPLFDAFKSLKASSSKLPDLGLKDFDLPVYVPPTHEETHSYQSAATLMRRLAKTIKQWRSSLPQGIEPAVVALLHGGVQIQVDCLAQEGFHGIRIEGTIDTSPCMVLAHQSTVQLLCYARKVEPEQKARRIGFIIDGEQTDA